MNGPPYSGSQPTAHLPYTPEALLDLKWRLLGLVSLARCPNPESASKKKYGISYLVAIGGFYSTLEGPKIFDNGVALLFGKVLRVRSNFRISGLSLECGIDPRSTFSLFSYFSFGLGWLLVIDSKALRLGAWPISALFAMRLLGIPDGPCAA